MIYCYKNPPIPFSINLSPTNSINSSQNMAALELGCATQVS